MCICMQKDHIHMLNILEQSQSLMDYRNTETQAPVCLGPVIPLSSSCHDTNRKFSTPVHLGTMIPMSSSCHDSNRNTPVGLGPVFPMCGSCQDTHTNTPVGLGPALHTCRSCQDTHTNTHTCRSGSSTSHVQVMSRYAHTHTHL